MVLTNEEQLECKQQFQIVLSKICGNQSLSSLLGFGNLRSFNLLAALKENLDPIYSVSAEPNKASNPGTPSRENRFSFLKGEGDRILHRQSMSEEKCETLAFSAARPQAEEEAECALEPYLAPIEQEASPKEDITHEEIDLCETLQENREEKDQNNSESPKEHQEYFENCEEAHEEEKEPENESHL